MSIYLVSGIDTDIGKTIATGMMARFLHRAGRRVITVKMVQTGNRELSEDIVKHRELMGTGLLPEDGERLTMPQIFRFPASPHLAAKLENRVLDLAEIDRCSAELARKFDLVLLEGAGGLAVPLTEELLTVDYAAERRLPVILVTSGRLGSLNHTIMSLEMLSRRAVPLAGIVYNWCREADPVIDADSFRMTGLWKARYGYAAAPLVRLGRAEPGELPEVDFSSIFA